MPTTSQYKGYSIPVVSSDSGVWGNELNTTLALIDQNAGGTLAINVTGSSATTVGGITMSSSQLAMAGAALTGTLGQNYTITLPSTLNASGMRWFYNGTTSPSSLGGPFAVKVVCNATPANTITIPFNVPDATSQAYGTSVMCDGTNVYAVGDPGRVQLVTQGGTGLNTLPANAVLVGNGTSNVTSVAVPTVAKQVLAAPGVGLAPTFQLLNPTLLNTVAMAGQASVSDTTSISANFGNYMIVFSDVQVSSTTAVGVALELSQNGGASYLANVYSQIVDYNGGVGIAVNAYGPTQATGLALILGLSATNNTIPMDYVIYLWNPLSTTLVKRATWYSSGASSTGLFVGRGTGYVTGATALLAANAFRIFVGAGTFSAGTMRVYGLP